MLADLTWPEVEDHVETCVILAVPLGSTEQHGPHLPLSTDTDIAVALCQRLAAVRTDVLVAPALAYGSSGEHAGFPGTLSIGQEALELVVVELCRSATIWCSRVLLVSAHGGNSAAVSRAVDRLQAESRDVHLFQPHWSGDPHAGHVETSVQLALDPVRVRTDRLAVGDTRALVDVLPDLRRGGVLAVSPSGVLGDPTQATAEQGAALLGRLTQDLVADVDSWCPRPVAVR